MAPSSFPAFCDTRLLQLFDECEYDPKLRRVSRHWCNLVCGPAQSAYTRRREWLFSKNIRGIENMSGSFVYKNVMMYPEDENAGFAHPGLVVFDVASNERNIIGQHGCHFVYHNPVSVHVLISQDTRPAGTDDGSSDMGGSVSGLGANMCVDIAFCAEFPERAPFVVVGLMSSSAVVPVYAKCVTRRGFTICNPNDVAVDVSYMIVGTIKHK